mmetsp:Transcript_72682/g.187484  ORF Transcript_72682/g.187484 Transcript_72682/m.187484 type:complete len:246 (-) Transcript_72682:974-1711(-)
MPRMAGPPPAKGRYFSPPQRVRLWLSKPPQAPTACCGAIGNPIEQEERRGGCGSRGLCRGLPLAVDKEGRGLPYSFCGQRSAIAVPLHTPMLHPVPGCSSYRKSNEVRAGRAARPARTMQEASVRQLEARTVPRLGVPVPTRMRACKRSPRAQRAGPAQTVQRNPRCSAVPRRALRRRAPSAQWRACRRQRCPPVLQEATAPARYLGRPHIAPYARRGAPRGMQGRCRELSARPQREGPPAPPRP